jgi:VanZ family protein
MHSMTVAVLGMCAAGWVVLTFYMLSSSNPPTPGVGSSSMANELVPIVGHLGLFGVLAALLTAIALAAGMRRRPLGIALVAIVAVCAAYGGAMELYQSTVEFRYASWSDGVTNTVGAIGGATSVLVGARLFRPKADVAA